MKIPASLYGPYRDVDARCRRIVTALARGSSWDEAMGAAATVDTADVPGLFVLNGPSPTLGGAPQVQCFLPPLRIKAAITLGRLPASAEGQIFDAALRTAWGTLCMLSPPSVVWVEPPERRRPLLDAALRHWPTLAAEGARYTVGSSSGQTLWEVHTTLKFVLANMGVSPEALRAPLPAGGPGALVPPERL